MLEFPVVGTHGNLDCEFFVLHVDVDIGVEEFDLRGPSSELKRVPDLVLPVPVDNPTPTTVIDLHVEFVLDVVAVTLGWFQQLVMGRALGERSFSDELVSRSSVFTWFVL